MPLFNRKRKKAGDDGPVDPEERSPQLGVKYKDLSVLGALMDQGADLSQPRHVLHYCYFPTQAAADQAAATARQQGWEAETREPLPQYPNQWSMVAERRDAVLLPPFVRDSTDFFEHLAQVHDGDYDGWEAGA